MRRGLKPATTPSTLPGGTAARAAPYEKGTETGLPHRAADSHASAARAAPYEKGTETNADARP